ncbi:hypothetical protein FNV43_RR18360 [Rhamnella rubrinervis]|uniref:Uncharacterized protein n=1 Tax=Rhamnella rubrinervis TaxID=2594499 RepID=A0A8K0GSV1_9ROSA|nr:hypothetical protein FNV43_RR18360 [Rhamnella rubrinervis]
MAEIKEIINPNKLPQIDITPTKNICPDQDDESVIIDIPEELEPDLNRTCWIHRVPTNLRQVNEAAYTPQLVSIGPFHHGKPKYKSMEDRKAKYQQQFWKRGFCERIVQNNVNVVEAFMKDGDRMQRIRRCYAGTFDHVDDLAKVILRDACFIFELFLRNYESKIRAEADEVTNGYVMRTPWLKHGIELDLILLENQVPFFVFTELFDFIMDTQPVNITPLIHLISECKNQSQRHVSLLKLVIEFFGDYYCNGKALDEEEQQKLLEEQSSCQTQQIHHTTDLKPSPPAGMTRFDPEQTSGDLDIAPEEKEERSPLTRLKEYQVPNVRLEACDANVDVGGGGDPSSESDHVAVTPKDLRSDLEVADMETEAVVGMKRYDVPNPGSEEEIVGLTLKQMKRYDVPNPGSDGGSSSESDHDRHKPVKNLIISNLVPPKCMERLLTIKHFTDLVRQFLCPQEYKAPLSSITSINCLHSAKKLDRAGVKFIPCKNQYMSEILNNYDNDNRAKCMPCTSLKVMVPKFKVEDDMECVMRNVMALEQCLYPLEAHICNYVSLLDQLIDTAEDVELLMEKRVVENLLGSNEAVANLINKLRDQIVEARFCYSDLCQHLNRHYDNWWSVSKETLKRVYFKDLWTGSSTVVGFAVTLFSVVSVISTIQGLFSG